MTLQKLTAQIADALIKIDSSRIPFRGFKPGVGPYGEPQLVKAIAEYLEPIYPGRVATKRVPDLLILGLWSVEFKIVRPFGDNGKEAENWSVNLLHPYRGNASALGDCIKLASLGSPEKKAVIAICYEHNPTIIPVEPLLKSFELLAREIMHIKLGTRVIEGRAGLVHPVHQQLQVAAWEVVGIGAL